MPEINDHLLTKCNFTEAAWDKLVHDLQVHQALSPFQKGNIKNWISAISRVQPKQQQRENAGIILFFWWQIWKEHNARIFEHKVSSFLQVMEQTKNTIATFHRAFSELIVLD
jgi:hypothetical protein